MSARYDEDFFAWTEDQARALREAGARRENEPVDWENVAEEIESVGRSDAKALASAATQIIEHLLKLEWSPAVGPRAVWRTSVLNHRVAAWEELDASPSLRGRLDLVRAFARGRLLAIDGLARDGVRAETIPTECSYTLDQILDAGWWPGNRSGGDE